jgi:hypothetical protein
VRPSKAGYFCARRDENVREGAGEREERWARPRPRCMVGPHSSCIEPSFCVRDHLQSIQDFLGPGDVFRFLPGVSPSSTSSEPSVLTLGGSALQFAYIV